jgi:hypothetical protein
MCLILKSSYFDNSVEIRRFLFGAAEFEIYKTKTQISFFYKAIVFSPFWPFLHPARQKAPIIQNDNK